MSLSERIEALQAKHALLDEQLHDETHRPLPSSEQILRLKREKLRLKDEMARLAHQGTA